MGRQGSWGGPDDGRKQTHSLPVLLGLHGDELGLGQLDSLFHRVMSGAFLSLGLRGASGPQVGPPPRRTIHLPERAGAVSPMTPRPIP